MHRTGSDATTETRARPRTKTYTATTRQRRWTFPRGDLPSEKDGGGRSRTDANDDGDERRTRPGLGGDWREDLGWAATGGDLVWAATGTHDVRQNGAKEKKRAGAIGENKIIQRWGPHFGFAKSKYKVLWSWTIFRLCK